VWKAARTLALLGTPLEAVRNRGYRLAHASQPLDAARVREAVARDVREHVGGIETVWSIGSTNSALLERANPPPGKTEVLLAEYQTAGRGRRGRVWLAPAGGAICLSLSWTFRVIPEDLGALSLVIGVCAVRALRNLGLEGVSLKWPNDLLVGDRKLAGILIELRAESTGPACVVIGVGLNVALGAALLKKIGDTGVAATDLASTNLPLPSRNDLIAALVAASVRGLLTFEREGLKPFLPEWHDADALRGRAINVSGAEGYARGLARGVDVHGALLVETAQGVRRFISGDVTVRAQ